MRLRKHLNGPRTNELSMEFMESRYHDDVTFNNVADCYLSYKRTIFDVVFLAKIFLIFYMKIIGYVLLAGMRVTK